MQLVAEESKERGKSRRDDIESRSQSVSFEFTPSIRRRRNERHSYDYRSNDLEQGTFGSIGFIARRASDQTPRFNLNQRILLSPHVGMDWAPVLSLRVETLALNILISYALLRPSHGRRTGGIWLKGHAEAFAELFLCTMPEEGGCIPNDVIAQWLGATSLSRL